MSCVYFSLNNKNNEEEEYKMLTKYYIRHLLHFLDMSLVSYKKKKKKMLN